MKKLVKLSISLLVLVALVSSVSICQAGIFGLSETEKEECANDSFVYAAKKINKKDVWLRPVEMVKVVKIEYEFFKKSTINLKNGKSFPCYPFKAKGYCYINVSNGQTFDMRFCIVEFEADFYEDDKGEGMVNVYDETIKIVNKINIKKSWQQDLRERFSSEGLTADSPIKFMEL